MTAYWPSWPNTAVCKVGSPNDSTAWFKPAACALVPWIPFLLIWLWAARYNPITQIPFYGDTLEVIWGANWYAGNLAHLSNPLYFEGVFYPVGWPTALLAHTPLFLLAMGFFRLLLTEAAPYNLFLFASFAVAYVGTIRAARLYTARLWIAILVGLLYAFWGMRWVRLGGHLHTLWLSALLPWLFLALQISDRRRRLFAAALVWALCTTALLYGIWIGALVIAAYFLSKPSWSRLREIIAIALLAFLFSLPTLILFLQAREMVSAPFYSLDHIAAWGASLNSLPIPALGHPWLGSLAQKIYSGPRDESSVANLGLIAVLAAVAALLYVRLRDEKERFPLLLTIIGLTAALGPLLRWNGRFVQTPIFAPLNRALWELGHFLKPAVFPGDIPPDMANGLPLPGWLLYAVLPFIEGNRVAARFAFIGGLGLVLLLAILLNRLKSKWVLAALAVLLLFERVPWPARQGLPLPVVAHPAFTQLGEDSAAIIDLIPSGDRLTLAILGETLYATGLHQKPTAAGIGTMWPESAWVIINWLQRHPRPLQEDDFVTLLQGYDVDSILLHMQSDDTWPHVNGELDAGFTLQGCIDPAEQPSPWPDPICIIQIAEPDGQFNAAPRDGWSAPEPWGRWAVGAESEARWVVPQPRDYVLEIDAFPNWIDGRSQEVRIWVNDQELAVLTFTGDAPRSEVIPIPADFLQTGWNHLTFQSAYAVSPAEATAGANPDPRPLSFAVTKLILRPSTP